MQLSVTDDIFFVKGHKDQKKLFQSGLREQEGNFTKIETFSSQQEEIITKIHVKLFPSPHVS